MTIMQQNPIDAIIAAWPSRKAFADAVGVRVEVVHKWARAGRIPAPHQKAVRDAAQLKGLSHVTGDWIIEVHADQKGAA